MSLKNSITTADYIEYDTAIKTANKLLASPKTELIARYILVAINTGLRSGDILKLTYDDLRKDQLSITEQKTGKHKKIALNPALRAAIPNESPKGIFTTQKGGTITIQHLNRLLKKTFHEESQTLNISSHSLRKCFGRRVFTNNNESEKALIYLMELFNHTSLIMTSRYLGIRQEELNDIYLNL